MKKFISIFLAVLVIFAAAGLTVALIRRNQSDTPEVYTITYKAVQDGEVTEIDERLYDPEGNYPESYTEGKSTTVNLLKDRVDISANEDLTFLGWYLDETLETAFDGTIDSGSMGNITLYAKISHGYWTDFY